MITNIKNGIINEFYYNAQNKLVKVEGPDFYCKFKYDSQNRRIAIVQVVGHLPEKWRYTMHDGNIPVSEADSSGNITKVFVRGIGIAEGTGDIVAEIIGSDSSAATIFI